MTRSSASGGSFAPRRHAKNALHNAELGITFHCSQNPKNGGQLNLGAVSGLGKAAGQETAAGTGRLARVLKGTVPQRRRGFVPKLLGPARGRTTRSIETLASVRCSAIVSQTPIAPMKALEQELQTYREKLPSLLSEEGKFALIHGGEVAGTFDTYADALGEGYRIFKLEPFLVKQIQAVEQAHFIARVA